jgi:uncharacterized protein YmfQ (DUF2313 family)
VKHIGTENVRDVNRAMYDYLPSYYEDIREARAIIDTESAQFEQLHADIADVLAQFFVDTATWGLTTWERICGLSSNNYVYNPFSKIEGLLFSDLETYSWGDLEKTAHPKSIEERRGAIKSRLRGYGTVTKEHIQNVAKSYANGDVEVVEDYVNYKIIVRFVNKFSVPSDLEDLQEFLREIIPAHLEVEYVIAHLLIRNVHEVMTLSEIEQRQISEFA